MKPITLETAALIGAGLGQEWDAIGENLLGSLRHKIEAERRDALKARQDAQPDQVKARIRQTLRAMRKVGIKV